MKLLSFGDLHEWHKSPSSRIDNFEETKNAKIKEIIDIAQRENVVAMLQTGDFLHKHNIPNEHLNKIMNQWTIDKINLNKVIDDVIIGNTPYTLLEQVLKEIKRKPIIGIVGNHEVLGESILEYEGSSLNTLVNSGFMQLATKENPVIIKSKEGFTVAITGSSYTHNIDDEDKSAYIVKEKLGDFHIHLVHGMLMEKSIGKKFKHTTVEEIAYKTKADLTISGHNHIGFPLIEIDGKKFINSGSVTRLSADKKEINRMPKVLLIDISLEKGIEIEEIYLKSAQKGENVLTRNHIDAYNNRDKQIREIEKAITKANLEKGFDIRDIIEKIAINENIDKSVIKETIAKIKEQMNLMQDEYIPKGEYFITALELKNFESHKDSKFEFCNGLNILAGESRNGKSSIIRALRETFECYMKNPRNSIRHGEDGFEITVYLSNGFIIKRVVSEKKNGKNGFYIYNPETAENTYSNTKGIKTVQSILGYTKVELSPKNKIGMNFMYQGQGWFFIGDEMTSPDKAKLIGAPFGTQYADSVLKEINSDLKKINNDINNVNKEITSIENNIGKFNYLNPLNDILTNAQVDFSNIKNLSSTIKEVEKYINEKKQLDEKIDKLEEIKKDIYFDDISFKKVEELKVLHTTILKIQENISDINEIKKSSNEIKKVISLLSNFDNLIEKVELIRSDNNCIKNETEKIIEAKKLEYEINLLEISNKKLIAIENVIDLSGCDDKIDTLKLNITSIKENEEAIRKYKIFKKESLDIKKQGEAIKQILGKLDLTDFEKIIAKIQDENKKNNEISNIIEVLKSDGNVLREDISSLKKVNEKIENSKNNYKNILKEIGECPICHKNIENNCIDEIIEKIVNDNY